MPQKIIKLPIEELAGIIQHAVGNGGSYEIVVTGNSMSPTLKHGRDQVRLVSQEKRPIRKGEIVLAWRKTGGLMLHRVIKVTPDTLILNGDGQVWTEAVERRSVIAVAESICRKGHWISCDAPLYRGYVALWRCTRPARDVLVKLKKRLTRKKVQ